MQSGGPGVCLESRRTGAANPFVLTGADDDILAGVAVGRSSGFRATSKSIFEPLALGARLGDEPNDSSRRE